MANPATLYRFRIQLSDIDRSVYEAIDVRVPMHPSETEDFLLTRTLAYALNYQDGLELLPGLCLGDEPSLKVTGPQGDTALWIDIGNPSARRIHRASKASRQLKIYTYKDPAAMLREAQGETIHRADSIEVVAIDSVFLRKLAVVLRRDNRWTLMHNDSELMLTVDDEEPLITTLERHRLRN